MQTNLHPDFKDNPGALRAAELISACVHCGFCTAHCPTYQHLGDERDGPRGRIYLIKQFLEKNTATENTATHLNRCLTCRACETVCPAGVEYAELKHIGKQMVQDKVGKSLPQKLMTATLSFVLPHRHRVALLFGFARLFTPLMPQKLAKKIPPKQQHGNWPAPRHDRKMVILEGCATSALTPNTNFSTARILDQLGVSVIITPKAGCCGAVDHHMGYEEDGLNAMRANIDAWWPLVDSGIEAILITASACSLQVKEYAKLLAHDPAYADKAARVSNLAKDISEVLLEEDLEPLKPEIKEGIAVHCPCTLQHGQNGSTAVRTIFSHLGLTTRNTQNDHLCCGSAGTYSLQQPGISQALLKNKLRDLTIDNPDMIVTSNIGCQLHLSSGSDVPVKHWIELLDEHIRPEKS